MDFEPPEPIRPFPYEKCTLYELHAMRRGFENSLCIAQERVRWAEDEILVITAEIVRREGGDPIQ